MAEIRTLFSSAMVQVDEYLNQSQSSPTHEEVTETHEIVFLRRGTFMRYDAFGKVFADTNHVLFFHRQQPYQISYPIPCDECSTIFALDSVVLLDIMRTIDPSVEDRPDRPFLASHLFIDPTLHLRQYQLLSANNPLATEEHILTFLADVLHHTLQGRVNSLTAKREATAHAHTDLVHEIKLVLGQRFQQQLRLAEIAQAVNVSPFFLCRVFKRATGSSVHQYVQSLRLLNALEHLAASPRVDLTELAFTLGFASHSHFSTVFGRTFGMPPSAFRTTLYPEMSKILKV